VRQRKRRRCVVGGFILLLLSPEARAEVAFWDSCAGYSLVMNDNGSGRTPLPTPTRGASPLDVSRGSSPLTVLLSGLHAVAVHRDGTGGFLVEAAIPLLQPGEPGDPGGAPGEAGYARFSPAGDRIAYVSASGWGWELYIGDVVRDPTGRVIDLTNITLVANLSWLGSPSDSNISTSFTGQLDFSPDGTSIIVTIYDDLWVLTLAADGHTLASSAPLTRTRAFAERNPRWSPAGTEAAFTGGPYKGDYLYISDKNIYAVIFTTGAVRQVTTKANRGGAGWNKDDANWSADATTLLFTAEAGGAPRSSPCGMWVNHDLFTIRPDGSQKAVNITNTVGTSVEATPRWGW
jgi:Tol biopolymer transport system component